jgi:hypothetical protein
LDIFDKHTEEEINAAATMGYSRFMQQYKCGTIDLEAMRENEIETLVGKDEAEKTEQIKEASYGRGDARSAGFGGTFVLSTTRF